MLTCGHGLLTESCAPLDTGPCREGCLAGVWVHQEVELSWPGTDWDSLHQEYWWPSPGEEGLPGSLQEVARGGCGCPYQGRFPKGNQQVI